MPSAPIKPRWAAPLALAVLLASTPVPTDAGVISDMIAKRRSERQIRSQSRSPAGESAAGVIVGATSSTSMSDRFKKRFAFKGRNQGTAKSTYTADVFAPRRDSGLFKTSR